MIQLTPFIIYGVPNNRPNCKNCKQYKIYYSAMDLQQEEEEYSSEKENKDAIWHTFMIVSFPPSLLSFSHIFFNFRAYKTPPAIKTKMYNAKKLLLIIKIWRLPVIA